jgi:hypothetical protein
MAQVCAVGEPAQGQEQLPGEDYIHRPCGHRRELAG